MFCAMLSGASLTTLYRISTCSGFILYSFIILAVFSFWKSKCEAQLGIWGCYKPPPVGTGQNPVGGQGTKSPEILFNTFWTAKTCFAFNVFNCYMQHIALVNTFLTSMERPFGYLFHLSSYMLNGANYKTMKHSSF